MTPSTSDGRPGAGAHGVAAPDAWSATTTSAEQTSALGAAVASHAVGGDLIALIGILGSGKTQFVRGMAADLGVDASGVSSPTFVLMHEHTGAPGRPTLVHVDAYRLTGRSDLDSIGWEDAHNDHRSGGVVVVEWADRLGGRLGGDVLEVRFEHVDEEQRTIHVRPVGNWEARMGDVARSLDAAMGSDAAPGAAGAGPGAAQCDAEDDPALCPICKAAVSRTTPSYPFCSPRCGQVDLHRWLKGAYVIRRSIEDGGLEDE